TPIGGWLALGAYLAVYPAVWVWLCWRVYPAQAHSGPVSIRGGIKLSLSSHAPFTFTDLLNWFRSTSWPQRVVWGFQCAALWVGLEMIVGRMFTGFPWLYLGVSQYRMLPVIQLASVTGVYGVSFLAVWFSISLASGL